MVLISLASLFNYVLGELWNFWSAPSNPHFWKYEVPFVDAFRVFEMPLLGYFGYLPFGLFCWIWWLHSAHVLGVAPDLSGCPEAGQWRGAVRSPERAPAAGPC